MYHDKVNMEYTCRHCGFKLNHLDMLFLKDAPREALVAARQRQYSRAAEEAMRIANGH